MPEWLLQWLQTAAWVLMSWPIDAAGWVAGQLERSSSDARWFIADVRNGLHWLIDAWLGWLPDWFFGWVRGWAHDQVNRAFEWTLRVVELLQNWAGDLYALRDGLVGARDGLHTSLAGLSAWLADVRWYILEQVPAWIGAQAQAIYDWAGGRLGDLGRWVDGSLVQVREFVSSRLGDLGRWVDGSLATVRDWAQARLQEIVDLVQALLQALRDWTDARLQEIRDWTAARVAAATQPLWDWIAGAQALLDWLRLVQLRLQAFLVDPGGYVWAALLATFVPRAEAALLAAWDAQGGGGGGGPAPPDWGLQLLERHFPTYAVPCAAAIAACESGWNPRAHNTNGEDSRGIFQLNVLAHPDLAALDLYDPEINVREAARLWAAQGWTPWLNCARATGCL